MCLTYTALRVDENMSDAMNVKDGSMTTGRKKKGK